METDAWKLIYFMNNVQCHGALGMVLVKIARLQEFGFDAENCSFPLVRLCLWVFVKVVIKKSKHTCMVIVLILELKLISRSKSILNPK